MNKFFDELVERYEIHSDMVGFGGEVRKIGFAYKKNYEDHYLVRLNTLPGLRFFVRRDSRGERGWLIFSGMVETKTAKRFFNPTGQAERVSSNYMKLKFQELNLICYLRLSPKDYHYTSKAA